MKDSGYNVLSLFDGKSSGYTALELAGISINNYYSSEIDKYAIQVSKAIHPKQIRLGDVQSINYQMLPKIDLIIAGSPCQGFSMAGNQLNFTDPRSALFFEFVHAIKELKPKYFFLENVVMKKEYVEAISKLLGVKPIKINSSLVSAQNRSRLYWTNIKRVNQPKDQGVILKDIIENDIDDVNSDSWHKWFEEKKEFQIKKKYSSVFDKNSNDKAICMTARQYDSWNGNFLIKQTPRGNNPGGIRAKNGKTPCLSANSWEHNNHLTNGVKYRKLTPRECFRLQTTPEHLIDKIVSCGVSRSQLYKIAGNGWTDEVIAHIFRKIK